MFTENEIAIPVASGLPVLKPLMKVYVKRTELYQNEQFIKKRFEFIGIVSNVEYMSRVNAIGQIYNSAIVTFTHWHNTPQSCQFLKDLGETRFGDYKFNYRDNRGTERYWFIKEQTDDQERIMKLKDSAPIDDDDTRWIGMQLLYYKHRNLLLEKQNDELTHNQTIMRLQSDNCIYESERMKQEVEDANQRTKNTQIMNDMLQIDLQFMREQLAQAESEIKRLNVEVSDRDRIIDYYETGK
jgi:hypothetical protein